jgi:hypothetical protein
MVTDEEFAVFAKNTYIMVLELQAQVGAISFALQSKNALTLSEIQSGRAEFSENEEYRRLMTLIQHPSFPRNVTAFLNKDKGPTQ